jgi:hypothetical protein
MNEIIERMAKAVAYEEHPTLYWPGDKGRTYLSIGAGELACLYEIDAHDVAKFRRYARAALQSLREPTEEMRLAGAGPHLGGKVHCMSDEWHERIGASWQAMIDFALSHQEEKHG